MTVALTSLDFAASYGERARDIAQRAGKTLELVHLPDAPGARLAQADCDRIDLAFQDRDVRYNDNGRYFPVFTDAVVASKSIRWVHVASSGAGQLPFVPALDARGVTITSSTGSNAEPVAQTGITGLLMLARGFATTCAASTSTNGCRCAALRCPTICAARRWC